MQIKEQWILPGSILLAAIIIAGSILFANSGGSAGPKPEPAGGDKQPVVAGLSIEDGEAILGDAKAPVTLVEYGDYQCPFCARFFSQTEPFLRENYIKTGKVKMVFRNFQFLGPESLVAAEAAECAKDQKKFWEYHDALYAAELQDGVEHNGNLNRDLFLSIARSLNLDVPSFVSCYDGKKHAEKILEDREKAQAVGVNSTPISFVDGTKITGAVPNEQFGQAIEAALSAE